MSAYPEEDDVEPTVALVEEPEPELEEVEEAVTESFDAELAAIEAEEDAVAVDPIPEPEQVALTPQGNKRGVTISEGIDYKPPPAKALERGKGDKGVDPRDHEIVGRKLVETLGALRGRGEDRRHRQRPARLPLRTAPGARAPR